MKRFPWTLLTVLVLALIGAAYMFRYTLILANPSNFQVQVWNRWMQRPCVFTSSSETSARRTCFVRDSVGGWTVEW